jgi:hypothetical protein
MQHLNYQSLKDNFYDPILEIDRTYISDIIELRKSNGTLSILLHPPPLSFDYGGEGRGPNVMAIFVPLFT